MRVLVSGGAGYIGSVVVHQLIAAGDEAIVIDDLSQGHRSAVHPKAVFYQLDLANGPAIDAIIGEVLPEAIMHFASSTLVGESMDKPFKYLAGNLSNGLNLVEGAVRHHVGRFILSSTANLFGIPDQLPIDESAAIRPGSPYGESKYMLERTLYWMDQLYGLRYGALRYFNACGAATPDHGEDHDPETHLIPLVLQVALGQREHITIYGEDYDTPDGTCIRDYVHVLDLASAHLLALRALDKGSRTYNLGNGQGFSVRQVIEAARRVTGHAIPEVIGPRRPGDPAILIAASERIKNELGWQPEYTDLDGIIETAWRWHSQHPQGYFD